MPVSMQAYLTPVAASIDGLADQPGLLLPDITLEPENIQLLFINEVVPPDPADSLYSKADSPAHAISALSLLSQAGRAFSSMEEAVSSGLYLTTAIKTPKTGYSVPLAEIKRQLPLLEAELALFPNLKAVLLMGDVAISACNQIARKQTKKSVIPSQSTYKIRHMEFYFRNLRVFPSYIMTGKNLLIEKGKTGVIVEDIQKALSLL